MDQVLAEVQSIVSPTQPFSVLLPEADPVEIGRGGKVDLVVRALSDIEVGVCSAFGAVAVVRGASAAGRDGFSGAAAEAEPFELTVMSFD